MADAHANFATSLVATAPSPATSGTSLVVTTGEGTRFPAVPFNAVLCPANELPTPANAEIVRVTARTTDSFGTIVRAQEGSSARTVVVGDRVFAAITKKTLTDAEVGNASQKLGASGSDSSDVTGLATVTDGAGSPVDMALSLTPVVDCTWVVDACLGAVKATGSGVVLQAQLILSVADVDGITAHKADIASSGTQYDGPLVVHGHFKLAAATAYTVTLKVLATSGTWVYYRAADFLRISAFTIPR